MRYYRLKGTNPYYNLAVEEYLFRHSDEDVFMLWQNEPSVIIGRNQNAYAEVDLNFAEQNGIHICRRITGGGAVYHDMGNVNYTFISIDGNAKPLDFEYFTRPIRSLLCALGAECTLGGRNDIECNGRKISGNAQHAEGSRILHHGTLLFNTDSDVMSRVLRIDKEKLEHKGVKSCRSRVVNLANILPSILSPSDFFDRLESGICTELGAVAGPAPTDGKIEMICRRNADREWIYSEKRYLTRYTVRRRRRYSFGTVDAVMELERDMIRSIVISGDFFGTSPIEDLERALVGMRHDNPEYIDPSSYIRGMNFSQLAELLL